MCNNLCNTCPCLHLCNMLLLLNMHLSSLCRCLLHNPSTLLLLRNTYLLLLLVMLLNHNAAAVAHVDMITAMGMISNKTRTL